MSAEADPVDLTGLMEHHLAIARVDEHGRSAERVLRDDVLRQSILALRKGAKLAEHDSPHAASVHMLTGRIRITATDPVEIAAGQLHCLTHERHGVLALEDSVFIFTTVTGMPDEE